MSPASPNPSDAPLPDATSGRIRTILAQHGRLNQDAATLADDADLYQAA